MTWMLRSRRRYFQSGVWMERPSAHMCVRKNQQILLNRDRLGLWKEHFSSNKSIDWVAKVHNNYPLLSAASRNLGVWVPVATWNLSSRGISWLWVWESAKRSKLLPPESIRDPGRQLQRRRQDGRSRKHLLVVASWLPTGRQAPACNIPGIKTGFSVI